jgi:hypothetical protein
MMGKNSHAIDELELMAYLDGELPRERAAAAAAHLEACAECKTLANELRGVSQEMASWQIESSAAEITAAISAELETKLHSREDSRTQCWNVKRRGWNMRALVAGLGFVVLAGLLVLVSTPPLKRDQKLAMKAFEAAQPRTAPQARIPEQAQDQAKDEHAFSVDGQPVPEATPAMRADNFVTVPNKSMTLDQVAKIPPGLVAPKPAAPPQDQLRGERTGKSSELYIPSGPMVIRTAELELTTTDFDQSRKHVEESLKRHHGYLGDLTVSGADGSARTLTATLRVPADQLDTTLAELKNLGRVESESQKGEEVTQQYVDLQARLLNARNSEQRLTELLRRAGKLSDVLEVEEQIESVRESIERMEAERKSMAQQVAFSTLNMTIRENYKERVQVVPDSTSTRIRNGAVEGYEMMVAGLINLLLFLVSWGPSLLLWGAILFWPARWLWRRAQRGLL